MSDKPTVKARGSNLPYLFKCPKFYAERARMDELAGENLSINAAAAHTGNAFHTVAAALRKRQSETVALRLARKAYPLADFAEVATMVLAYKSQPWVFEGVLLSCEKTVEVKIETPSAWLELSATMDVVERVGKALTLTDHKTGKPSPASMVSDYWAQLAGYGLAVLTKWGAFPTVYIYHARSAKRVDVGMTEASAREAINLCTERLVGHKSATPGGHCSWCNLRFPSCAGGVVTDLSDKPRSKVLVNLFPRTI